MSVNRNHFCLPLYLEKVENGAKYLETRTMVAGCDDAEFGCRMWIPYYYRQRRWDYFRNNRTSKMRIFVNFYLDQDFQGHLLQALDGQS